MSPWTFAGVSAALGTGWLWLGPSYSTQETWAEKSYRWVMIAGITWELALAFWTIVLVLCMGLSGCATGYHRHEFYAGTPMPPVAPGVVAATTFFNAETLCKERNWKAPIVPTDDPIRRDLVCGPLEYQGQTFLVWEYFNDDLVNRDSLFTRWNEVDDLSAFFLHRGGRVLLHDLWNKSAKECRLNHLDQLDCTPSKLDIPMLPYWTVKDEPRTPDTNRLPEVWESSGIVLPDGTRAPYADNWWGRQFEKFLTLEGNQVHSPSAMIIRELQKGYVYLVRSDQDHRVYRMVFGPEKCNDAQEGLNILEVSGLVQRPIQFITINQICSVESIELIRVPDAI